MLVQLLIQDIVLIDQIDVEFSSSLSVLTGETGAGKSILLDALSLALGGRGDGNLVREGAAGGQVNAVFSLPDDHEAIKILQENEFSKRDQIVAEGGFCELILRRIQTGDGRTRAFINNMPVAISRLREIGHLLVEIHGQHDDRALMDSDLHRVYLDASGGLENELEEIARAWENWSSTKKELLRLEARMRDGLKEADYLRACVEELEKLTPQSGEETSLATQRQQMIQAQNMADDLSEANQILSGQNSAAPILASLVRKLERKSEKAPGLVEGVIDHIDKAITHLYSAQNELDGAIHKSDYDPHVLDNIEERLFALRAAARKHNVAVENLPEFGANMAKQLGELDHGEEKLIVLRDQCGEMEKDYIRLAVILSQMRADAGKVLAQKVQSELPSLKLDQAEFLVNQESGEHLAGKYGYDKIEFWVRTNPGTKAGPMFKVASGGELSRFLLALKVVLAENGSAPTLVFDEIDTGVGGAVADAIGRRLARLSKNVQVLSVTHAPQVAARAQHHWLISKTDVEQNSKRVNTRIVEIDGKNRRNEIARMLAGASISDEAKAAADRLLSDTLDVELFG